MKTLLAYPVQARPKNSVYENCFGRTGADEIGDFLLHIVGFRILFTVQIQTGTRMITFSQR